MPVRPVFLSGENPGMTLYEPDTDHAIAVLSYWHVTDSPHGIGNALILWLDDTVFSRTIPFSSGIFTDNPLMAHTLTEALTQYFPEFENYPVISLPYHRAHCEHSYDNGKQYTVTCITENETITIEWLDPLDRRAISVPEFPIGNEFYELRNVVCPCEAGILKIKDETVPGKIRSGTRQDGSPTSTAFLAFAESWVGPIEK